MRKNRHAIEDSIYLEIANKLKYAMIPAEFYNGTIHGETWTFKCTLLLYYVKPTVDAVQPILHNITPVWYSFNFDDEDATFNACILFDFRKLQRLLITKI